ncbi:hypothetical protein FJQ98_15550 [Lysinibacillus agricola]|uniref:Uncharacterized protein n=1 Tax=Lysinibacillus agricola TaxID=2590012 RepID=A0ABX7B216_9BACI|nr:MULTISPECIES: hypothetical protein [Lysinibacillus]KOS59890.1 hypothetical protein AN161_26620 [Lysinibacillus sp. FJAT-14222]QQP15123.1 hypothetical protein FJQ98_15550 [Lysinibacillus agricola]
MNIALIFYVFKKIPLLAFGTPKAGDLYVIQQARDSLNFAKQRVLKMVQHLELLQGQRVVANASYATLSLAGGLLSLILIPVVIWSRKA